MEFRTPNPIVTHAGNSVLAKSPFRPGQASDYFAHLPEVLQVEPIPPVVLYCRTSSYEQKKKGNLNDQVREALEELRELGIEPVTVIAGVESSKIEEKTKDGNTVEVDRQLLWEAVEAARECGGLVVATSRDRLLRSKYFDGRNSTEAPRNREYLFFLHSAGGVQFATLCRPDERARSRQVRRGQGSKGNRGGRPAKRLWKNRRLSRIELARKLRADGLSFRQIAKALNELEDGFGKQTQMTVRNWLKSGV